jgi:hypothetical protein
LSYGNQPRLDGSLTAKGDQQTADADSGVHYVTLYFVQLAVTNSLITAEPKTHSGSEQTMQQRVEEVYHQKVVKQQPKVASGSLKGNSDRSRGGPMLAGNTGSQQLFEGSAYSLIEKLNSRK